MKGQYQQIQTALGNSNKRHLSHSAGCYLVTYPVNIRLDEDVLKTSFVFVFRRRLQDVLIKTNMFALALRLQKTSSRRLAKTSSRHLQDVFKTSSRRFQDVLKTLLRRLARISSRRSQDVPSS